MWSPIAGPLARLGLDGAWMRIFDTAIPETRFSPVLAANGETLVAVRPAPTRLVAVRIDPGSATLAGRPEFAALVSGLLDLAAGRPLLDQPAIASRPKHISMIAPRSVESAEGGRASGVVPAGFSLAPVLLVASLALLLWDTVSRHWRATGATAARVGILALIAVALWNPALPMGGRLLDLIVVLDESRSMAGRGWAEVRTAAQALSGDSRIGLVRYGSTAAIEFRPTPIEYPTVQAALANPHPPRRSLVDGSFTDTESAIRTALHLASPSRPTVLLVVSDGTDTHGSPNRALATAGRAGIDVYRRLIESPKIAGDCRIDRVDGPDAARVGQRIRLSVAVTCDRARESRVVTSLDGRPAAESRIEMDARGTASVAIELASDQAGTCELTTVLDVEGDPEPANNSWRSILTIDGPKPILMVSRDDGTPPLARSLADGGRTVRIIDPEHLAAEARILRGAGTVVLDDIAIADAPDSAWAALADSVEKHGTGLVVLGGPRSFGAGGYRGSRLEELLPVTAEPHGPVPRAAVLFLVDKSGSMEQDHRGVSRLAHARRAVHATTASLGGPDTAGLMWFDRGPAEAIPLRPKAEFMTVFDEAWTVAPSGGTTLVPALRAALEKLSIADVDQRLLVLVTDGITPPDEDLAPVRQTLLDTGASLIALVVGDNPQVPGLQDLADINEGVLLRIDDIARLPTFMRAPAVPWTGWRLAGPRRPRHHLSSAGGARVPSVRRGRSAAGGAPRRLGAGHRAAGRPWWLGAALDVLGALGPIRWRTPGLGRVRDRIALRRGCRCRPAGRHRSSRRCGLRLGINGFGCGKRCRSVGWRTHGSA